MSEDTLSRWIDNMGKCLTICDSNGDAVNPAIYVWSANAEEQLQAWVVEEAKQMGAQFPNTK